MKRFMVPVDFTDVLHPFHVYIGKPSVHLNPLHFQIAWLKGIRGGGFPQDVHKSFAEFIAVAKENEVSLEELCVYAPGASSRTSPDADTPSVTKPSPERA